jgi:hypothetical protein
LLDLRESTNFQEERQKPNYKCWKWNNKWKLNKFLNLSNKSKLKKLASLALWTYTKCMKRIKRKMKFKSKKLQTI